MDESSFNLKEKSINKTIQGSNQAYFGRFREIAGHECEVKKSFLKDYINICTKHIFLSLTFIFQLEMVVPMKLADSSFIIKKELPFSKFLNHQISMLRGSGIMQHILEKDETKKPCQTEENSKSIQFKKVIFPFFIYMIGVISALAIFFIELIVAHRNEKVQMGNQNHKKYSNTNEIAVQCDLILESAATLHRRISI